VVEVEIAEGQAVVGAHQGLENKRTHFLVAGMDGNDDVHLDHLVVVRDGPTDFVDGGFTAHGEADEFFCVVNVTLDVVFFAVFDERFEGRGEGGHGKWTVVSWQLAEGQ
jgi:hypothetical protein